MIEEIHRGETMLVSISADDFPITDLSDVVLTIEHGQTETQLHLEDFTLVTNPDTQVQVLNRGLWLKWMPMKFRTFVTRYLSCRWLRLQLV